MTTHPTLNRSALAGLVSGALTALLANVLVALLSRSLGRSFPQLSPASVAFIALQTHLLGALGFWALARATARPRRWFAALALASASLLTTAASSPTLPAGFAEVATPLHLLVAALAVAFIPRLTLGPCEDESLRLLHRST